MSGTKGQHQCMCGHSRGVHEEGVCAQVGCRCNRFVRKMLHGGTIAESRPALRIRRKSRGRHNSED